MFYKISKYESKSVYLNEWGVIIYGERERKFRWPPFTDKIRLVDTLVVMLLKEHYKLNSRTMVSAILIK